ncbi:alkaline phosphatase family protein [Paramicrobacterium agarici]|uniref:Type I phosphodiesterase/nucleotide pyrophosphatase n=1 Tax=Paramicrobacterium agarici TaxID=630514 RepID=A0A2A9DWU4_9MICO|nr:nucleotide pyrophosphatase/phosphodiesterase family protein [Microbacterium agarici]PFG31267.1 type I phosphodiesterase/nucleotide pyrophosphatase [Microbacterium agarici]
MTTMLPTEGAQSRSLAVLAHDFLATLRGHQGGLGLAPVTSVIVVVVDGLGTSNLAERAGHARFLTAHRGRSLRAPIPSTTAAALPTLLTGARPGEHGMLGYKVRDPASGRLVNQLTGWDELANPESWQRSSTVFETIAAAGIGAAAVGPRKFADSGFTRAVLRGARYEAADGIGDRVDAAAHLVSSSEPQFVYLYIPELDKIAHKHGWRSERWIAALETVDSELSRLHALVDTRRTGILVTADHGIIDVPPEDQVLYDAIPGLLDGVEAVGGEPRFVQLYADDHVPVDEIATRWRESLGQSAIVATRDEAIAAGWYGPAVPATAARIGDVLVAARTRVAFYDSAPQSASSRKMIGQHGSLSDEERSVPFIRLGAWV